MTKDVSLASPPYSALTHAPMTLQELDNHNDKDKIWALVVELRTMAYEEGYRDGWLEGSLEYTDAY